MPPKGSSKLAEANKFQALEAKGEEGSSGPVLPRSRPNVRPEYLLNDYCTDSQKHLLKLLLLGKYFKEVDESPNFSKTDRLAIVAGYDKLLHTQGGTQSLGERFENACELAENYTTPKNNENFVEFNNKGKKKMTYSEVRGKVEDYSSRSCFTEPQKSLEVADTSEKLTLKEFLHGKPKLMEEGLGAVPTVLGRNIMCGILDRIIIRCEQQECKKFTSKNVMILDNSTGFVKLDSSNKGGESKPRDDADSLKEILDEILKNTNSSSVLLKDFSTQLFFAFERSDLMRLRKHPLLISPYERISLLNKCVTRIHQKTTYSTSFADGGFVESGRLKQIIDSINSSQILRKNREDEEPIPEHVTICDCIVLLRNRVHHLNDKKLKEHVISDSKLDKEARKVFPDVFHHIFNFEAKN